MMNGYRYRASIAVVMAFMTTLVACIRPKVVVTATPVGDERTYAATPDSLTIPLYTTTKLECAYDEIAALTAEGYAGLRSNAEVIAALRTKARAIGAHAIIAYSQSTRHGSELESEILVRNGTAIRFRSADCMK